MYNPLSMKCGSFVAVDELDYRGKDFRVVEIQEYDHALGGKHFKLVNYVLQADQEVVRLRAVPSKDGFKAMLMNLYDDCAYNEGLHNVVPLSMMRSRAFAKAYGTLLTDGPMEGISARAVVVIDANDKVVYTQLVPEIGEEPNYDAALAAIAK